MEKKQLFLLSGGLNPFKTWAFKVEAESVTFMIIMLLHFICNSYKVTAHNKNVLKIQLLAYHNLRSLLV